MRLLKLLVCVLLCSFFIACSDKDDEDNKDNLELSVDYLNQSAWTGQYIIKEKDGKTNMRYKVGFIFTSEKRGSFTLYDPDGQEHFNRTENFDYSVDKKKLTLTKANSNATTILGGYWFVVDKEKDKLTLVQNKETEIYTEYLYLERTY